MEQIILPPSIDWGRLGCVKCTGGDERMAQETQSALTPEVKAMIGVSGEVVEGWGVVDAEFLRRLFQSLMAPAHR